MSYSANTPNKQPLLPQKTSDKGNLSSSSSTKPVFRLAPPKFTAPHISHSTSGPTQSKISPRLLAVRQPVPHGVNYRFALPPRPKINSSQATIATSRQPLPTSNSLARSGPPPLIPARSLPAIPNNVKSLITSQGIPIMKSKPQDGLEKKIVTAAPNVCVTERGTFVTAQVSKAVVPASTGNSIIGQSPDANALMNKMFSVVKYSNNEVVLTQVPVSKVKSSNRMQSPYVQLSKVQESKTRSNVSQSAPTVHKVSINVGGGMGAVTTAVRSGLLTKEEYPNTEGSTIGISEKSITEGGGFCITINDNNLESTTTGVGSPPKENEVIDNGNEKTETHSGALSKRVLWLHRRRKKKKARFTYVKGKGRKKKDEDVYAQMNDEDAICCDKQEQSLDNVERSELTKATPIGQLSEPLKRSRPGKLEEKDGKKRGRPPKRTYYEEEAECRKFLFMYNTVECC